MKYSLQLVWNREFNWANYGESDDLEKVRIVDNDTDKVVWNG